MLPARCGQQPGKGLFSAPPGSDSTRAACCRSTSHTELCRVGSMGCRLVWYRPAADAGACPSLWNAKAHSSRWHLALIRRRPLTRLTHVRRREGSSTLGEAGGPAGGGRIAQRCSTSSSAPHVRYLQLQTSSSTPLLSLTYAGKQLGICACCPHRRDVSHQQVTEVRLRLSQGPAGPSAGAGRGHAAHRCS